MLGDRPGERAETSLSQIKTQKCLTKSSKWLQKRPLISYTTTTTTIIIAECSSAEEEEEETAEGKSSKENCLHRIAVIVAFTLELKQMAVWRTQCLSFRLSVRLCDGQISLVWHIMKVDSSVTVRDIKMTSQIEIT